MLRQRKRIALLLNFLHSQYQTELRFAVERACARRKLDLVIAVGREYDHEDLSERAMTVLYDWVTSESIDGVVVLGAALSNYVGMTGILQACHGFLPAPSVSIGLVLPAIPSVILDNRAAMKTAVEHLIQVHACRAIAYIGGPPQNEEAKLRFEGYLAALEGAGYERSELLIDSGIFNFANGERCAARILDRAPVVDAIVAANDDIALGVMKVLAARQIRVPEAIKVVGFDDSPAARLVSRSLTSVAQPLDGMAEAAIEQLVAAMALGPTREVRQFGADLKLRESCGCGHAQAGRAAAPSEVESIPSASGPADRAQLEQWVLDSLELTGDYWREAIRKLWEALDAEFAGRGGAFVAEIGALCDRVAGQRSGFNEVTEVLALLRTGAPHWQRWGWQPARIDELLALAMALVSTRVSRAEGRSALSTIEQAYSLRHVHKQLSLSFGQGLGEDQFVEFLSAVGIDSALVAVLDATKTSLIPRVWVQNGSRIDVAAQSYPVSQLLPTDFLLGEPAWSAVAMPLTYGEEALGLVVFRGAAEAFILEAIRGQVAWSLKLSALHERVVQETALRERLAHQHLLGEMAIAKRIQTALAPADVDVVGLEIAASMRPADQVGGDYYDVIAAHEGAWIAVGDVTGHGLLSGLVMLMTQSMVGALVRSEPDASPAQIVCRVNAGLTPNIRERLEIEEHVTFCVLRYHSDGRIVAAGAHEDILVFRAAHRRVEKIAVEGLWLGIVPDLSGRTPEVGFKLESGDFLILYTDGLVEAKRASGEQFGLDRLIAVIERCADGGPQALHDAALSAVEAWTAMQQDDITLLVARYTESALANALAG